MASRTSLLFRANAVPIVVGLFLITFGVAIFGTFVNWTWQVNSYGVWAIWGGVALALGLGMSGFDALLREATAPFVTATGVNPQGDWAPMDVVIHESSIDQSVVRREARENALDKSKLGKDKFGRTVSVQVVPLGGRNAYGIHISSGGLGFLILRGNQVMAMGDAHRGEFYFTPRVFRTLDISEVEPEVIDVLRRHAKFVYGKSPLYELGTHGKGFIEYLWDNEAEIRSILDAPHTQSPIGVADVTYYQGEYHKQLSENATLRAERRRYLDTIQSQAEGMYGRSRRDADIYSTREPSEPAWTEATRKPQEEVR
jgi:hypothetical protein